MGKSRQDTMQRNQKPGVDSARKHDTEALAAKPASQQNKLAQLQQVEVVFTSLPDGIIACDREGKILQLNARAVKLFETSECQWWGKNYRDFLETYALSSEQQRSSPSEPCQGSADGKGGTAFLSAESVLQLRLSSGRRIVVNLTCSALKDAHQQVVGTVYVFHELPLQQQRALHLQRVYEAVLTLTEAIARLPESLPARVTGPLRGGSLLLSPPAVFIAQQLVDVIRQVLNCHRASLKALAWPAGYLHFVAGSGFAAGEEAPERTTSGLVTLSEAFNKKQVARLFAKQEVAVRGDQVYVPPGMGSFASESLLIVPLFFQEQLSGILCVTRKGLESVYTPEEIELVEAVANQATLIVECLRCMYIQAEARTREQALYEVRHLSNDFLALASHELRTPLTGIIGNLQLARRRLETLKRQLGEQAEPVNVSLAQAQQSLLSASQSARLQQRMINDLIDDARIQTNQLELHLQPYDLLALLQTVIDEQQRLTPEHAIMLEKRSVPQKIPVLIDVERVSRVFTTYLTNALLASPAKEPVTVVVTIEDKTVRVSVHNEGPGISRQEQEHLWERFYRAKGSSVQHELDLSLGLGLYLCRALIEYHKGQVGVQSTPGQGATFWFTLPIVGES